MKSLTINGNLAEFLLNSRVNSSCKKFNWKKLQKFKFLELQPALINFGVF